MSDRLIRFLLGVVSASRLAAMHAQREVVSKVSGVPLDAAAYAAAQQRIERCDRLSSRLREKRHDSGPEITLAGERSLRRAESPFDLRERFLHAWDRHTRPDVAVPTVASSRCFCEDDETAVRVHLALAWDVAWSSAQDVVPENGVESAKLGLAYQPTVGFRPSDPPKWAREWALIVRGLCEATGCTRHFPHVDLDRELARDVYTSSDAEKMQEDDEQYEAALHLQASPTRWQRSEPRGEDAVDRMMRGQRRDRGLREEAAIAKRIQRQHRSRPVAVTHHDGSMRKRWATETPKGRRWVETKQRHERAKWQEFYRLSRALGKNPATPAAKGWVETVGMDAALAALRAAVEKQPVAA